MIIIIITIINVIITPAWAKEGILRPASLDGDGEPREPLRARVDSVVREYYPDVWRVFESHERCARENDRATARVFSRLT